MSFKEGTFPGFKGKSDKDINLHYLEKISVDLGLPPVLIIPALPESAIDYKDILFLLDNRAIGITHRGRELSNAPESGYTLQDHGLDIVSAITHFQFEKFVLIAYSRGVSYTLSIVEEIKDKLNGIILIDYPAEYEAHNPTWPIQFLAQNWRAMPIKERFPKPWVLTKIQQESVQTNQWDNLKALSDVPVLLMIGAREYSDPFLIASKVTDEHLDKYKEILPKIKIVEFERSGHDLRLWEYDKFIDTIKEFLTQFDPSTKKSKKETSSRGNSLIKKKLKSLFNKNPGIDKNKLIKLNSEK